jgi:PQQ-dependent catabolism-associated CXXCW motif protein
MRLRVAGVVALGLLLLPVGARGQGVAEPDSYRTGNYRTPTPATLKGARVLTTDDAEETWKSGAAVFVDVMPQPPRPANLPPGTLWRDKPRLNIPGSIWLPDTGYGEFAPAMLDYFRRGLVQASGVDRSRLLVFYCLVDCWMSWNAAKRALELGYAEVAWYPDGTDGWGDADLPLADCKPEPRPGD